MGLIAFLKALFAGNTTTAAQPLVAVEYQGFEIRPEPLPEDGQFRVQGWISREGQTHHFIRADILPSRDLCVQETLRKARVLIDQQGSGLFK